MVSGKIIHAIPKSWKKDIKTDQGKRRNIAEKYCVYLTKIFFPSLSFTWKDVYILPCIVTTNTRL